MASNFEAALLYRFLISPSADTLVLNLRGNVAVQKNIRQLKGFFESISAVEKKQKEPSEGYLEFLKRREALINQCASRDDHGAIVQVPGGTKIEKTEEFNKGLEDLMISCKEFIDEHTQKLQEWEDYSSSECDIKISMIDEVDVKGADLSKKEFEIFSIMLKSPVEEPKKVEKTPEE